MNLEELRCTLPPKQYFFGGIDGGVAGVSKFWRFGKNLSRKKEKEAKKTAAEINLKLRASLKKFRLRWSWSDYGSLYDKNKFVANGREAELTRLMMTLAQKHTKVNYFRLFSRLFRRKMKKKNGTTENDFVSFKTEDCVWFVQQCFLRAVPFGFFGSRKNGDEFLYNVLPRFFGHKDDKITMASVLGGMDTGDMFDSSVEERRREAGSDDAEFYGSSYVLSIAWLMLSYLTPLLCHFFYMSDSLKASGELAIYEKHSYLAACDREVARLLEEGNIEEAPLGVHPMVGFRMNMRFFPKPDGSFRTLCVFGKKDKLGRSEMYDLKKRLNPVLSKILQDNPLKSSVTSSDFFDIWFEAVRRSISEGKPLFYVKLDVSSAYPNIVHSVLKAALDEYLKDEKNKSSASFADVFNIHLLWRKTWYKLARGVPQGSCPMSFGLCDVYHAYVLSDIFADYIGPHQNLIGNEGFVRYHDDLVFYSWSTERVKRFLEISHDESILQGRLKFNTSKTFSNLPRTEPGAENLEYYYSNRFHFCGAHLFANQPTISPPHFRPVSATNVRVPYFSSMKKEKKKKIEDGVFNSYLKKRSIAQINTALKWPWVIPGKTKSQMKLILLEAFRFSITNFIAIVSKTGALAFGREDAIWEKYTQETGMHFWRLLRRGVQLYYGKTASCYSSHYAKLSCLPWKDVFGLGFEVLLDCLEQVKKPFTIGVVAFLEEKMDQFLKTALQKEQDAGLPARGLKWKPFRRRTPRYKNGVKAEIKARMEMPFYRAIANGESKDEKGPQPDPLIHFPAPEDFLMPRPGLDSKGQPLSDTSKICSLCEVRLKSKSVPIHLGGKLHKGKYEALKLQLVENCTPEAQAQAEEEENKLWKLDGTVFRTYQKHIRMDPGQAVLVKERVSRKIDEVGKAIRMQAEELLKEQKSKKRYESLLRRDPVRAKKLLDPDGEVRNTTWPVRACFHILSVKELANDVWTHGETVESECVVVFEDALFSPLTESLIRQFCLALSHLKTGNPYVIDSEGPENENEFTILCERDLPVVSIKFIFTSARSAKRDLLDHEKKAWLILDQEKWLRDHEDFVTCHVGRPYSTTVIAQILRYLTEGVPGLCELTYWQRNLIAIRAVGGMGERETLRLGEAMRRVMRFLAAGMPVSKKRGDTYMVDPLSGNPFDLDLVEALKVFGQERLVLLDQGDFRAAMRKDP